MKGKREWEFEKKNSIMKKYYMQWGQFWDLSFSTFTLFLFPSYKVSFLADSTLITVYTIS